MTQCEDKSCKYGDKGVRRVRKVRGMQLLSIVRRVKRVRGVSIRRSGPSM
jgi:hypothetical protein